MENEICKGSRCGHCFSSEAPYTCIYCGDSPSQTGWEILIKQARGVRDLAREERDTARSERDEAIADRDQALDGIKEVREARDKAVEAARTSRVELVTKARSERDDAITERNKARAERDTAIEERENAIAAAESFEAARDRAERRERMGSSVATDKLRAIEHELERARSDLALTQNSIVSKADYNALKEERDQARAGRTFVIAQRDKAIRELDEVKAKKDEALDVIAIKSYLDDVVNRLAVTGVEDLIRERDELRRDLANAKLNARTAATIANDNLRSAECERDQAKSDLNTVKYRGKND